MMALRIFAKSERVEVSLDGAWLPGVYVAVRRSGPGYRYEVLLDDARAVQAKGGGSYLTRTAFVPSSGIRHPKVGG